MKFTFFTFSFLLLFICCNSAQKPNIRNTQNIIYQQEDKEILEQILKLYSSEKNSSTGNLNIKVGSFFKGTPYVSHTLETEPEQMTINLKEVDCNTFAEYVLAISRTIKSDIPSFEKFAYELQNMRYHNGVIDGYTSRIHYFSDWIFENSEKKLVKDVSEEIAKTPYPLIVNFMSTHPDSYAQLKDSAMIPVIAKQEKEISLRNMYYIPEEKLPEVENLLKDGDIAGITTQIKGLDILHVGILVRKNGRIHLMHASSVLGKVVISEETLEEHLLKSKPATGIMVARPL